MERTITESRGITRLTGFLAGLIAIAAVMVQVAWAPATPIGPTPSTSYAAVTMNTAVTGLADGSTVSFTVTTSGSVTLNSVEAKICVHGYSTYTANQYGYSGATGVRCVYQPGISSGAFVSGSYRVDPIPYSSVQTSGLLSIAVGTGTVTWTNSNGYGPATLTCDAADPCDLVIKAGLTGDSITDTYFIQSLEFGGGGATTTTTEATTTTTSASTTTTEATTTPTSASTTTTTAPATTTTSVASTTTTAAPTTTTTNPGGSVSPSSVAPGGIITVQTDGWKSGSSVSAILHSDPVALGTLTADGSGLASARFSIPANVATGSHSVVLTGTDPSDAPRIVTIPVTVATGGSGIAGQALAFTGAHARDLTSVALLLIAVGLFVLGQVARRRGASS
ncbi:MAG: hypothetical protein WCI50_10585 [Actinomycetes bacterium]